MESDFHIIKRYIESWRIFKPRAAQGLEFTKSKYMEYIQACFIHSVADCKHVVPSVKVQLGRRSPCTFGQKGGELEHRWCYTTCVAHFLSYVECMQATKTKPQHYNDTHTHTYIYTQDGRSFFFAYFWFGVSTLIIMVLDSWVKIYCKRWFQLSKPPVRVVFRVSRALGPFFLRLNHGWNRPIPWANGGQAWPAADLRRDEQSLSSIVGKHGKSSDKVGKNAKAVAKVDILAFDLFRQQQPAVCLDIDVVLLNWTMFKKNLGIDIQFCDST